MARYLQSNHPTYYPSYMEPVSETFYPTWLGPTEIAVEIDGADEFFRVQRNERKTINVIVSSITMEQSNEITTIEPNVKYKQFEKFKRNPTITVKNMKWSNDSN